MLKFGENRSAGCNIATKTKLPIDELPGNSSFNMLLY